MDNKRLTSLLRQALDDYHMINPGDKIAVGISGGKDSLTLISGLSLLQKYYPLPFEIQAITVDLGFEGFDTSSIEDFCKERSIPYHLERTQIADIVFHKRKESNPCSLCAKMRKGALNNAIKALGCNKVAYAHHMDDVVETYMLNLIYEGRFSTFMPITHLDRMNIDVIRPMIYIREAEVIGYTHKYPLPIIKNPCPADGYTSRQYVKELLDDINRNNPGIRQKILNAISTSNLKGWNLNDNA